MALITRFNSILGDSKKLACPCAKEVYKKKTKTKDNRNKLISALRNCPKELVVNILSEWKGGLSREYMRTVESLWEQYQKYPLPCSFYSSVECAGRLSCKMYVDTPVDGIIVEEPPQIPFESLSTQEQFAAVILSNHWHPCVLSLVKNPDPSDREALNVANSLLQYNKRDSVEKLLELWLEDKERAIRIIDWALKCIRNGLYTKCSELRQLTHCSNYCYCRAYKAFEPLEFKVPSGLKIVERCTLISTTVFSSDKGYEDMQSTQIRKDYPAGTNLNLP